MNFGFALVLLTLKYIDIIQLLLIIAVSVSSVHSNDANNFGICDYYTRLNANEGTSVVNPGGYISIMGFFGYLGFFNPTTSCRYFIECPKSYVIRLYCYINIAVTVNEMTSMIFFLMKLKLKWLIFSEIFSAWKTIREKEMIVKRNNFEF